MLEREPALPGQPVVDPACWTGEELAARQDWIFELSAREISDLGAMAASVRERIGDDASALVGMTADDFYMGAFASRFEQAKQILKDGVGVVLIRGLPVDDWDRLNLAIAYWGIGNHVGRPQSNNPQGDMIGHVTDKGKDLENPNHRAYQTNAELFFHVDQCDMLALLCVQQAKSGGRSKVVSSIALHNEMLKLRPDLAKVLAEPFIWSLHGEQGPGQGAWFESPVFNYVDGYLSVAAGYKSIEKGHKLPGVEPLTATQWEALNYLEDLGNQLTF
ncbi:MAG: TauD/TfdA family dioxygenase, partial [Rhodospirillales bacterium]|nr:TauD/TfdA family dioxygenase [Rhodospirillales bacterium]